MNGFIASVWWLLRRSRVGLLSLLIGITAFELIQPVAVKSFGDLERLTPFLSMLPNSFWAMMNVTPDFLGTFGLSGYLSLGYTHPVYLLLTETIVIWFGSRSLAGEMERGSIQFALSRPVSRTALYATRVVAILIVTTIAAVTGPTAMFIGVKLAHPQGNLTYSHLAVVAAASWLLIWAVAGTTLLWSALSSTMSRAIGLAAWRSRGFVRDRLLRDIVVGAPATRPVQRFQLLRPSLGARQRHDRLDQCRGAGTGRDRWGSGRLADLRPTRFAGVTAGASGALAADVAPS